ncbi:DExH-box ATP-dependent RNA helicase DExH18 [Chlorella vulgaris]
MSLAALRRAIGLRQLQPLLLRAAASGLAQCMLSPCAIGGSVGGGGLPAAASSHLWRYDSPLLRHLNTAAAEPAADGPALPPYEQVKQRAAAAADLQPLLELRGAERTQFDALIRKFQHSGAVKDQALALYVNSKLYRQAIPEFKDFLVAAMDRELWRGLRQLQAGESSQQALFPYFAQFVLERYTPEIKAYRDMVNTVDLRNPHQWFPVARALQRRIIYHAGPTNSGKTYNALQAMRAAKSGVYCGPLRLLAMEVYDTCNAEGLYCNLITGQERREVPGAEHTACTVEMVGMQKRVDVAVIDEIQMIGDEGRGWAWTRALMGVPANEVHICGDSSAVPLVRKICEDMGEQLEVNSYDRFTTLEVESSGLVGGYSAVQPGDCIVAFSRRDIYAIKQLIEQETSHRACVVYGALPPETRRQQARLFNEQDNAYRVMVASDAVGMGLNLNIRRVIFHSVTKHEGGNKRVPVSISMLKQIAGRAGRRSSQWSEGLATCLNAGDVPRLQEAIDVPLDQLATPTAGLFPEFEHFEVFAGQRPDDAYSSLLEAFEREAMLDSSYFFCKQDSVVAAAQLLGELGLSIKDMFSFCMAPASASDLRIGAALLNFATKYSKGLPVTLDISVPNRVPSSTDELRHMEAAHQVSMLWLWLSYRFDADAFPNRDKVEAQAEFICDLLDKGLKRLTRLSKNGVDIAEKAARPEHQNVMSCFSEELALLEERRQQQRTDERRQQTHEQRQQRAEERRQRVLDSGIVFASPAATSAAAAGASPASISAAEAAEEAGQAELRRPGHKARSLTRKKEPTLQHAQQCDARQRRRILKKLQQNRQTERQLEERAKGRQAVPVVLKHEAVSQQQVSSGSSTSGWGRLSSAFQ